jgi:Flp pilus assembly pilin Flp
MPQHAARCRRSTVPAVETCPIRDPEPTMATEAPARMIAVLPTVVCNERGQTLAEYALILALIAILAVLALLFIGGQINSLLSTMGNMI